MLKMSMLRTPLQGLAILRRSYSASAGGFNKAYVLSKPLAAMVGSAELSRPQAVKQIWAYIKSHNLQDPEDKRYILCDKVMRSVFNTERVHMFTMNKLLSDHLHEKEQP
ncbi:hypothetical protein MAPG_07837 [Magnaporthiopsis poae ATCC 64411]|uniref:DM2 domain-containing protein n=1 Tax=Magnaporthiopsis poae (strain ATCC 64411 / 73-15) TaxID=644358 RepID=A0A0C4E5R3_MAGP6|nr:hypothetical protein MAPG_07837 [Magnaporthiopsis poae ATCC 64411]